jgi:hypothetical protein
LCLAALPVSAADPLFGPETYVRTTGAPDVYTSPFDAASAGPAYMWVLNGDRGGSRVTSGSIALGNTMVATDVDFKKTGAYFVKPVTLVSGANTLTVTLTSAPGSFITVVIVKAGSPDVSVGRLILPWTSSANLVLALKSGAHRDRVARIVVYDAAGNVQAWSGRLSLNPRGAVDDTAANLITSGSTGWTEGSIEVFYAGLGPARLFGQAVANDATTGIQTITPLQHAGHRRLDPTKQTPDDDND